LGLADFSAARSLSDIAGEFIPNHALTQSHQERYALFNDAVDALLPWFQRAQP